VSPSADDACIFCKIVRGEAPAHVVGEDERTLVFLDIFPVADGHTLIVPKAHCADLFDADAEDLRAVVSRSQRVAAALRKVLAPDGLGVFQLNGAAAGQTVFHYHMHLIPRHHGDGLQIHSRTPGDPARLADLAARLSEVLAGLEG
jgi:histidine triad (HIT) family protein